MREQMSYVKFLCHNMRRHDSSRFVSARINHCRKVAAGCDDG